MTESDSVRSVLAAGQIQGGGPGRDSPAIEGGGKGRRIFCFPLKQMENPCFLIPGELPLGAPGGAPGTVLGGSPGGSFWGLFLSVFSYHF